jgi:DNA repair protein RadD
MIQNHYLLKLLPKNPGFQVDDSGVHTKAGEYDEKSASQAFRDQDILERAVDSVIWHGIEENRHAWLSFAQSIDDCELIADMFKSKGYPVEAVHSRSPDRDAILTAFKKGELRGVVNKDVLTTGFDNPRIDLLAIMRLTRSPGLWVQILGRGTRPLWTPGYDLQTLEGRRASILASQKQDCRVLDFAGNTSRLGPINYPTIPKTKKKGPPGEPPVRQCPQCAAYNHISVKVCEECGYEFPPPEKLVAAPGDQELVVDLNHLPPPAPKEFGIFRVDQMVSASHKGRNGKPDTMRVDYFCGVRRFSTWVCFAHKDYPRRLAERWWASHTARENPVPDDAADGVARFMECNKPSHIKVWLNTKYPEIVAYDFMGTAFELPPELGGPPRAIDIDTEEARIAAREAATQRMLEDDDIPF